MAWDPATYSAFAAPRLRPALDLMDRIPVERPARVVDLGCGTGNVTRLLAERWPEATTVGVDSSPEMLAAARAGGGRVRYEEGDAGTWAAAEPVDVLFSNAALHWLDGHGTLLPRLLGMVKPGGVLAVQMPRNHGAASHTCMVEAARSGPWRDRLEPVLRPSPVAKPSFYYDVLAPVAAGLDIWESEYLQVLEGERPVVRWTMGTALKPLLDALDEPWRGRFLTEYAERIDRAYPLRADGRTLFPFRRLFIVATAR
jgi:trans-aconitate 2-methyltransferase